MSIVQTFFKLIAPRLKERRSNRDFLLEMVPKGTVCVEIGVWKGEFSKQILDKVNPKKLYLIDPWKFIPKYTTSWYGGTIAKNQEDMNIIYKRVQKMFKDNKKVVVYKDLSQNVAGRFKNNTLDFVYVDGNHRYEFVKKDLEMYFQKLKKGGILAGDDYYSFWSVLNGFPVKKAVDEFIINNQVEVVCLRGQFVLRK